MQRMEGNLVPTITGSCRGSATSRSPTRRAAASRAPARSTSASCSTLIDAAGYEGWVGLEYNPTTATTEESLGWMPERSA